jgi:hypothetical protein
MATASPREQASAALNQQKDTAASSLGSFAGALRDAASRSEGNGADGSRDASATRMAEWAADGLERVSNTLRSKDLDTMVREAQSFARSQPVAFFFAAAAAGFLATRFLKAGTGDQRSQTAADFSSTPRV